MSGTHTISLIIKGEYNYSNDNLLVTLDVDSLYTNIDNKECIKMVKEIFKDNPIPPTNKIRDSKLDDYLLELLQLSAENNDFIFNAAGIYKFQEQL